VSLEIHFKILSQSVFPTILLLKSTCRLPIFDAFECVFLTALLLLFTCRQPISDPFLKQCALLHLTKF